ncbi:acetolactate decarboxylase [Streptomyces sp. NPDC048297]|uniref:acetolactate decarboxylase n=1 Tax=Streptomyces sp. NPDC048297 TaxID=3365531 RepID=UPI00371BEA94
MKPASEERSREDFRGWARSILVHHASHAGVPGEVYQTSTIGALLDGVYDGDVTIDELLRHGDFGLGTFNRLDGEMLVLDGVCHHLRGDGSVRLASGDELTPFAAVTRFVPDTRVTITEPCDRRTLTQKIDEMIDSPNLLYAVRVTGTFDTVHTRTVMEQKPPYPPLTQATAGQQEAVVHDTAGTLAGYRTPAYEQGIAVAGYHLHFIDEARRHGGHALDLRMERGTIEISAASELHLSLPRTPQFLGARLSPADIDRQIRQAEGS